MDNIKILLNKKQTKSKNVTMTDIRISQKMKRKASWVEKKVLQNGKSNWKNAQQGFGF